MAAYNLLDQPIFPPASDDDFTSIPFHSHNSIRSGHFNEKKRKDEKLYEADSQPHQEPAEAVLIHLDDEFSRLATEKNLKDHLSIEKEMSKSHQKQIEMNRQPENNHKKIVNKVEKVMMKFFNRRSKDMSFMQLQSIYEDNDLEVSPEEIMSYRYIAVNKLVMTVESINKTTMAFSGSVDQSEKLGKKIRSVLHKLWEFDDYGNLYLAMKIKTACSTLNFCQEHLDSYNRQAVAEQMRCDAEVSSVTGGYFLSKQMKNDESCTLHCKIGLITMKILQLQRKAREDINNVLSNLDKQMTICRHQLDALEMNSNDLNLLEMWQDANNLCNSNLQQLGLAAAPFTIAG